MSWFYVFKREKKETEILGLFISQQQGISWREPGMEAVSQLRSYISEDVRPHLRSQRSYFRDQTGSVSSCMSEIKSFYYLYIEHVEFWVSNTPVASYSGLICQICLFASEKSSLI